MSNEQLTEVEEASRLVYKGLKPRHRATQDTEYAKLIAKWDASPNFRALVRSVASSMELMIMDVTSTQILLRPHGPQSTFRMSYQNMRFSKDANRGVLALVFVAVGAAFFRTGNSLTRRDAPLLQMTIPQIVTVFTELCERIAAAAGDQEKRDDTLAEESWRVLLNIERDVNFSRASFKSREGIVQKVVSILEAQNMLIADKSGKADSYIPTPRLRLQLADVMTNDIFHGCITLLGVETEEEEELINA